MLVSRSKYVAFHVSGQIMRRGDTFEFDKVTIIIFILQNIHFSLITT